MAVDNTERRVVVRFTEQQITMLEQYRQRHTEHAMIEDVVVELFRQYADRTLRGKKACG